MPRVLVVLGTRPEAIKLAPVIMEMRKHPADFEVYLCATGQHRDMAQRALATFELEHDYIIGFRRRADDLVSSLAAIMANLDYVLKENSWDLVMVQGDTTSALAGALSAFYHKIPVAHVEAGLRTYDKTQPWPEEVNRRLITQIADWHFCPTKRAYGSIQYELNVKDDWQAQVVGNTVIDALLWVKERYAQHWEMEPGHILVTAHRRETWGMGTLAICKAIKRLVAQHEGLLFVWPLHPNPLIRELAERELGGVPAVLLKQPMSYPAFVRQMMTAQIILTDSGGIQEEAPTLNTPVLILRDKTERPEVIECGAAKLVGTDPDRIVAEVTRLLTDKEEYERMANAKNPFGDGHAAERIVDALEEGYADRQTGVLLGQTAPALGAGQVHPG